MKNPLDAILQKVRKANRGVHESAATLEEQRLKFAQERFAKRVSILDDSRQKLHGSIERTWNSIKDAALKGLPSGEAVERTIAARSFLASFVETADSLTSYASKPSTFPNDRYRLSVFANVDSYKFAREKYRERGGSTREPISERSIYLDAPFGAAIVYLRDDGKWEPISVVGFFPDLEKEALMIDQLQGGDTSGRLSEEGKKARMKLRGSAEQALYEVAADIATRAEFRGVGLRKPAANRWDAVTGAAEKGRMTPYDIVAKERKMRGFASEEYFIEPVPLERDAEAAA